MYIDDTIIDKILLNVSQIPTNPTVMTDCHAIFADYMRPYVPMNEGMLSGHIDITPKYVHYLEDYAHYQYTGLVYGPNIPIFENGVIVGWWSRPNKTPTGKMLNYSTERHDKATREWDKAMLRDKGKEFTKDLGKIITNYLKGYANG